MQAGIVVRKQIEVKREAALRFHGIPLDADKTTLLDNTLFV
jgi:hypothetical protein